MAIQPIDLQTLYSQLGTVSKTVAFQQQGVPLQNAIEQEEQTKRLRQKREAVEAPDAHNEGPAVVKNNNGGGTKEREKKDKKNGETENEKRMPEVIKDPRLGQHVDISG